MIENVSEVLGRRMYSHHRYFRDVMELSLAEWASIVTEYLIKLYRSIPKRLSEVIDIKGDCAKDWIVNVYVYQFVVSIVVSHSFSKLLSNLNMYT